MIYALETLSGGTLTERQLVQTRKKSALVVLAILVSLFSVITPNSARAGEVTGWPRHLVTDLVPRQLVAFGGDSMSLTNCESNRVQTTFRYIHDGVNASSLPPTTVGNPSPPHDGISCTLGQALATADGTFYTTHIDEDGGGNNTYRFVGLKNGRTLWSVDLSSDPVCSTMSSWGSAAHDAMMTNASIGSDGNIYGMVQAPIYGCATYLVGISSVDGHQLFTKKQLTTNGSQNGSRMWVYDDKILTTNGNGLFRQSATMARRIPRRRTSSRVLSGPSGGRTPTRMVAFSRSGRVRPQRLVRTSLTAIRTATAVRVRLLAVRM